VGEELVIDHTGCVLLTSDILSAIPVANISIGGNT
jgi:hypothetical protein